MVIHMVQMMKKEVVMVARCLWNMNGLDKPELEQRPF